MKDHIDAIKVLLAPTGYQVYYADVVEEHDDDGVLIDLTYPYVLLWSSAGLPISETLCGTRSDLDDTLGVTTVGATTDSTLIATGNVRASLAGKSPVVSGRYVHPLSLDDSQTIQPDRDVTLPTTNRHPIYAVDLYALKSEPA